MIGLTCRECGRRYPKEVVFVCEYCFGNVEVEYDYEAIRRVFTPTAVERREASLWRYRELLPIEGEPTVGLRSGFTPLFRARRLAEALGMRELYVKDDSVSHPTLSFKDRVVSVALTRAKELGFDTVACASTGNLANAVAAHAARAGLKAYVFIPADLEMGKVVASLIYRPTLVPLEGTYDEVNRLCTEIVGAKYPWAFVNVNIRPYYAEGSKTYGFEIAEQLGWRIPRHIVVPAAGGSLVTKIGKAFKELALLGFVSGPPPKLYVAQAAGCGPIANTIRARSDIVKPVSKPDTIAKSLAIGSPADGYAATKTVLESGGWADVASDEEIIEAMKLLAETEGVFTETAGGVTLAVAKKLIEQGIIPRDEATVISITGNGLKTQEPLVNPWRLGPKPAAIKPTLAAFELAFAEVSERVRK
jgi:threonine synthase